jgi:hypothetical protein
MNFAMATLGLKEMGKFLWEGREKSLPSWLSHLTDVTTNSFFYLCNFLKSLNISRNYYDQDIIKSDGY